MPSIFISYRREDNSDAAGRINDRLTQHFGEGSVYFDIESIPLGANFPAHIDEHMAKTDVVLVVMGENWLCQDEEGKLRLENPDDFVRIEVEAALARNIPVIPVLVGKGQLPGRDELPVSLQELSSRNAAEVRSGAAFRGHMEALIRGINNLTTPEKTTAREGSERLTTTIFGGLGVISILFLAFAIMNLFPSMRDVLLIKIVSVLYFGVAGLACVAGYALSGQALLSRRTRAMVMGAIALSAGLFIWAFLLDGFRIAYDEIAAAWILAGAGFLALSGIVLMRK